MKKYILISALLVSAILTGCASSEQKDAVDKADTTITISAAASLKEALTDIKEEYESANKEITLQYNFGSSGSLAQQISQGAPVDLFFSAAEDKFAELQDKKLIDTGVNLLGNEIVLIASQESGVEIEGFNNLGDAEKISIGTPETVPAGMYAKETLQSMNLWESVESKLIYAKDVRQVLTYVETNNVDAGIVYKTDAMLSSKIKVIATAPEDLHDPVIYPLGIIKASKQREESELFYEYLQSEEALAIFEKYGFKGLDE